VPVRRFLLLRLAGLVSVLLASSFIVYGALFIAPGSPESVLIGGRSVSPSTIAAIRAEYHLDSPFLVSYVRWLDGVIHGDFGRSLFFRQDVAALVWSRIPTTLALTLYASLIIVIGGVALGVIAAVRGGRVDRAVLVGTSLAAATPSFVAAIALITVFAVKLEWLPVFGSGSGFGGRVEHLTLPAVALAFAWIGLLGRVTRSAMIDQLGREHVETARSRGIPEARLVLRHGLRNALVPISTIAGLAVAGLLSGAVIVEDAFGLNGLGSLLLQSVLAKDFPVVQAICLILVAAFVVVNTVVDALYGVFDPRLAATGGRGR
jgi:peptide/nickel transport system permease protein